MSNKYEKELNKEKGIIKNSNPFNKNTRESVNVKNKETERTPYFEQKEKPNNYFNLILGSDFNELELEIRGIEQVSFLDNNGKTKVELRKKKDHYLSDEGASDVIGELRSHVAADMKLGRVTDDEFKIMMRIVQKTIIKFFKKNLERLGMDTEAKQRKARPLLASILNRIWMTYSRSIYGKENSLSHGNITLSGALDGDRNEKYNLEEGIN